MSWVEWLAGGLIAGAGVTFLFGDYFFGSSPGDSGESVAMKDAFAPFVTGILAVLCAALGLLLFLVKPLLSLGPRVPLWLIPTCGVGLFLGRDSVCKALHAGDSLSRVTCAIEIQDITHPFWSYPPRSEAPSVSEARTVYFADLIFTNLKYIGNPQ
jgi:hypothetical protein